MDHIFTNDLLADLQARGFIQGVTKPEVLDNLLNEEKVTVYAGFDCTADSLHVGNLLSLMLLRRFKMAGHSVVAVIGTGTTLIGDPSGKDKTRPIITPEQVALNADGIEKDIRRILGNGTVVRRNGDWLLGLNYIDFLREVGSRIPVNKMLALDSVKSRLDKEEGMSFLEFNYSLFQAFDFLTLTREFGTVIQVGGSDQWGNITMGCELIRRLDGKEGFGLTTPLIMDANGEKFGKSAGNAVWLSGDKLNSFDFWQFWRNVDDRDVRRFLNLFSDMPVATEEVFAQAVTERGINALKKVLAGDVTRIVRGTAAADQARFHAEEIFEQGQFTNLPEVPFTDGEDLATVMVRTGKVESKGAARRLIEGKGVKIDDVVVEDKLALARPGKLSIGKRYHFNVVES